MIQNFLMIVRLFLSYIVLFKLDIALYIKLFLLMFIDTFDCASLFNLSCASDTYYHYIDKVTDIIVHIIVFYYLTVNKSFSPSVRFFLKILLIYRVFGVILFLLTKKKHILAFFPDYFREFTICYAIKDNFDIGSTMSTIMFYLILFGKPVQEYFMHYEPKYIKFIKTNIFKKISIKNLVQ